MKIRGLHLKSPISQNHKKAYNSVKNSQIGLIFGYVAPLNSLKDLWYQIFKILIFRAVAAIFLSKYAQIWMGRVNSYENFIY